MFKFKQYDFKRYSISLIIVVLMLCSISSYLILQVQPEKITKHLVGVIGGIMIAIFISLIDYHFMCQLYLLMYAVNLGLLVWVKVAGKTINYAQRWIDLGFFDLQPSELSKIILILFMAKLFSMYRDKINKAYTILLAIVTLAIPTSLIFTQTDLSTSLVIVFVFAMMIFAAGLSWKIILPVLLLGIPTIVGLFWYVQQPYQALLSSTQQQRVLSILDPELYPDIMYQQENSSQAIGSGQLIGKSLTDGASDIRAYDSVPIAESDFIFAVAGEELGFIGSCFILGLYAFIIYQCLRTAKKSPDYMGMLIAIGLASMFAFQTFVNIGVATSILPNTGIPLPFMSSGLSSLMGGMIAIGIVLNIRLQPKKYRG